MDNWKQELKDISERFRPFQENETEWKNNLKVYILKLLEPIEFEIKDNQELDKIINSIWIKAFTHISFDYNRENNYEILEVYGDSIINKITAEYLIEKFPSDLQSSISNMKNYYASNKFQLILSNNIFNFINIVRVDDRIRKNINSVEWSKNPAADIFESIIGAISHTFDYITQTKGTGYVACYKFLKYIYDDQIKTEDANVRKLSDNKSQVIQILKDFLLKDTNYTINNLINTRDRQQPVTISVKFDNRFIRDVIYKKIMKLYENDTPAKVKYLSELNKIIDGNINNPDNQIKTIEISHTDTKKSNAEDKFYDQVNKFFKSIGILKTKIDDIGKYKLLNILKPTEIQNIRSQNPSFDEIRIESKNIFKLDDFYAIVGRDKETGKEKIIFSYMTDSNKETKSVDNIVRELYNSYMATRKPKTAVKKR